MKTFIYLYNLGNSNSRIRTVEFLIVQICNIYLSLDEKLICNKIKTLEKYEQR